MNRKPGHDIRFANLFQQATEAREPHPYQDRLATVGSTTLQLLSIPTGLGKTAAAVLAWIWRRQFADSSMHHRALRRIDYCLPIQIHVEPIVAESTNRSLIRLISRPLPRSRKGDVQ